MTEKITYRIGIDIGGTSVKAGIIDAANNIVAQGSTPTNSPRPASELLRDIGELVLSLLKDRQLDLNSCISAGVGCPGTVDNAAGVVLYSNNLVWENVKIVEELQKYLPLPIRVSNDANCAALGEVAAGAASDCQNAVMITLGTGVGAGIIIDGKIFEGAFPGGAELGHILLHKDGKLCSCGRKGCIEAYASATALERDAKEALIYFPDSLMAQTEKLDSKAVFEAVAKGDLAACGIVYNYIVSLAEGLTDIVNIFRPEKIIIGGGIGQAGDVLLKPLNAYAGQSCFGGADSFLPVFVSASLGNNAGIIGAANL